MVFLSRHVRFASRALRFGVLCLLVALGWVMFGPSGSDAQRTTPQVSNSSFSPVAEDEVFIVYRDANGRYACRAANKTERDRINKRSGGGRTHLIYNGASHEKAALRSPSDPVMPALQTSAGLRIVLHGTNALNQNPQARDAFIVAANRWEAVIATPITVVNRRRLWTNLFWTAVWRP